MPFPPSHRAVATGLAAILLGALVWPAAAAVRPAINLASPTGLSSEAKPSVSFSLKDAPGATGMPKKWRRALVQLGLIGVYSTYRYWSNYHLWVEDWQFQLTFADQYRRFLTTEAITFDSNAYVVNWTHVIGGALYYQMARTNYLSWQTSLLASFTASAFYEYVSEWREVISINDMLTTTFGGYSLGETWFQLSDYFHHRRSPVLKFLGFMNPINKLNQWLDRKNPASRRYAEPGWAGLVLSAGWRQAAETGRDTFATAVIGLETQLIRTPEYGRPGTFHKVLRDTSLSEISAEVALRQRPAGEEQLRSGLDEEVDLYARVVGLAWYRQNIDELGRGTAFSLGLGSALTYLRKRPIFYDSRAFRPRLEPLPETPTDFRDKMTITHLLGPVVDWTRFGRGVKIRAVADAYVDFALMNAFAFNAYSAGHPIDGMKTTLDQYGYAYAFGGSVSGRVDVDWGNLWLRGLFSAHAWASANGRDRFQSDLTNNIGTTDTRTRFLLKAGWRLPSLPLRVFLAVEGIHRWGRIGDVTAGSQETRTSAGLSYLF